MSGQTIQDEVEGRCLVEERDRIARQGPAELRGLQKLGLRSMPHRPEAVLVGKSADSDSSWKRLEGAHIVEAEVHRCCDRLQHQYLLPIQRRGGSYQEVELGMDASRMGSVDVDKR